MFDGLELKTVFGPLQLFHTDSTKPCFIWKMVVKAMVPLLKCLSLHYFIHRAIEIPSNLELGDLSRKLSSLSTA